MGSASLSVERLGREVGRLRRELEAIRSGASAGDEEEVTALLQPTFERFVLDAAAAGVGRDAFCAWVGEPAHVSYDPEANGRLLRAFEVGFLPLRARVEAGRLAVAQFFVGWGYGQTDVYVAFGREDGVIHAAFTHVAVPE